MAKNTSARHFHHDCVAHYQSRNESSVSLVKRVIKWADAENDTDGAAAELGNETAVCG
jgi:hypothetical protein